MGALLLFFLFREAAVRHTFFWKNATATTPGPVCVPITLQISVDSSLSICPCQRARLSSTYFCRHASLSPLYPSKTGREKSTPPHWAIFSVSRLFPCFEPRALPTSWISPSWMVTTGLMLSSQRTHQ